MSPLLPFRLNPRGLRIAALALLLCSPLAGAPAASSSDVISYLNQTLVWYRQLTAQQELVNEPSDYLFLNDNRQIGKQVVKLAFEYARNQAKLMQGGQAAATLTTTSARAGQGSPFQRLIDTAAKSDQQVKQAQQEINKLQQQLEGAPPSKQKGLQAAISETQAELDLFEARRDTIRNMLQFATGAGQAGAGGLQSEIEELSHTVPDVALEENTKPPAAASSASGEPAGTAAGIAAEHKDEPAGILALITDMVALHRKRQALDSNLAETDALEQSEKNLRAPLSSSIRELSARSDQFASQAAGGDPAVLAQQRKDVEDTTAQFKQLSSTLLPLGKQTILLDLYKRNLGNWRGDVQGHYSSDLKNLALRIGVLGIVIGLVLGVSALWKRALFRYVTDVRRRYQFNLLRRIVMWFVITVIVGLSFASELGAITTFAGLLTAGIAVALQNVILSIAGYFFLIGRYGVRVGDRIQIAGVTGDVVDVGLIRLHLMEVGSDSAGKPTGRVVVFSNAVVFQPNAGLFKQIPGTNFVWHEITLTLAPDSDYREVEKRMMEAVNKVYAEYKERIEAQRRNLERSLHSIRVSALVPESRLRLKPSEVEIVIRYPVEMETASEIDDRITRELLAAIDREPRLRMVGSSAPKVQKMTSQPVAVPELETGS